MAQVRTWTTVFAMGVVLAAPVSAQAPADTQDPWAARAAVLRALEQRPDNADGLRSAAVLSTWIGDYASAIEYYQRLETLTPDDAEVWLALGRVRAWNGDTDEAAAALRRYVQVRPDASEAWIELAKVESWRGNHRSALAILDREGSTAEASDERTILTARVWTAAGRPRRALRVLSHARRAGDGAVEATVAQALALAAADRPGAAHDALIEAIRLQPASRQTRDAARAVRAATGSTIEPLATVYSDSDHLDVRRLASSGTLVLRDATRVAGGYERVELRAPAAGGLGRIDGRAATREAVWTALSHRFGAATLSGRIGGPRSGADRRVEYAGGIGVRSDALTFSIERTRSAFVVSPRTVEAGLQTTRHAVQVDWSPAVDVHLMAVGTLDRISDGNTRWELTVSPRTAVARRQHFNLDAGMTAYRLEASRDLANGYYDPRAYESYAAALYSYWKVNDDVGVGTVAAWGAQREAGRSFQPGGHVSIEATAGIYRAWMVKATSGMTNNTRLASGAYRGVSGSLVLVRRF